MSKKYITLIIAVFIGTFSCKKDHDVAPPDEPPYVNLYPRPWKTEFISYKNVIAPACSDDHSRGYKLYYKDTLVRSVCSTYQEGRFIDTAYIVNDSTMFLFDHSDVTGVVLYTKNGGYSWEEHKAGSKFFPKFYVVNPSLIYCVTTGLPADFYFLTGIVKSDLYYNRIPIVKGKRVLYDRGAGITDRDSTVLTVNDSLTVVIRFK